MNVDSLDNALEHLARDPQADYDVAELALLLARDEYPKLDVDAYLGEIQALTHDARSYVRGDFFAQINGLGRYLFHEVGLHGNRKHYYDPRNSYLNDVLDRLTGIPISLSVLTMAIGRRLGLDIVGIGLPGHFIVQFRHDDAMVLLDPFHGGRRLTTVDCENLVRQVTGLEYACNANNLQPVPLGLLLQRMLNNLRSIYLGQQDWLRASVVLGRVQQLSPQDVALQRDLGLCQLHLANPGKAMDHFRAYLNAAPEADDFATIQQYLKSAQRDVSRWN